MHLSICTITARAEPHYEWLLEALARQARHGDVIEIVVIDFHDRDARQLLPNPERVQGLHQIQVSPPKPNPWQGPYRVTSRDLHAIANARNTAFCLATHPYVAFLDDRVRPGPCWLATIRDAAERDIAICGPYDRDELRIRRVRDGRSILNGYVRQGCPGIWFYGGNFALPLAWALAINGCEEGSDPVGRQDRVMGSMLVNAGKRITFHPGLSVLMDRKLRQEHPFPRINKGAGPGDKASELMRRFCSRTRTEFTPDLALIRAAVQRGEPFPLHTAKPTDLDWYDSQPIGEM